MMLLNKISIQLRVAEESSSHSIRLYECAQHVLRRGGHRRADAATTVIITHVIVVVIVIGSREAIVTVHWQVAPPT